MKFKKLIYIILFVVLGIIVQGLIHVGLEVWYIDRLVNDFNRYSLGLSWLNWFVIHHIFTAILALVGIVFGLWQGFFWWRIIYIEKRLEKYQKKFNQYLLKKHAKKASSKKE